MIHSKKFQSRSFEHKLFVRENDKGLTFGTSALKLQTVANLCYQLNQ